MFPTLQIRKPRLWIKNWPNLPQPVGCGRAGLQIFPSASCPQIVNTFFKKNLFNITDKKKNVFLIISVAKTYKKGTQRSLNAQSPYSISEAQRKQAPSKKCRLHYPLAKKIAFPSTPRYHFTPTPGGSTGRKLGLGIFLQTGLTGDLRQTFTDGSSPARQLLSFLRVGKVCLHCYALICQSRQCVLCASHSLSHFHPNTLVLALPVQAMESFRLWAGKKTKQKPKKPFQ